MIPNQVFFNDDTLNIFTDASIVNKEGEYIGCAGAIACTGDPIRIIDTNYSIIRNSTNNNSEITGIWNGIQLALKYRYNFKKINLISDSKISIFGLREWIYSWCKASINSNILINSQFKPVANQDIFLMVVYTIINENLNIEFFHQKGHVSSTNDLLHAKKVFKDSNNLEVDDELIANLSKMNDLVDKTSRNNLMAYINTLESNDIQVINNYLVSFFYNTFDIEKYKELIKGGK